MNNGMDQLTYNNNVIVNQEMRMAGARGVNTQILDKELGALVKEASVIEKQMQALSKRLEKLQLAIADFDKTLVVEEETQVKANAAPEVILPVADRPKPVVKASKTKPVVTKPKTAVAQTSSNVKGVVGVRVGVHKDKTRLVFDVNGATSQTHDFDKEAGLLTISLPQTSWATSKQKTYRLSQISGYDVNAQGQGSVVAMAVKNTSSVKITKIKSVGGKPARLVVDLMK